MADSVGSARRAERGLSNLSRGFEKMLAKFREDMPSVLF
jgi:hypothetical protein